MQNSSSGNNNTNPYGNLPNNSVSGNQNNSNPPSSSGTPQTNNVAINNYAFSPSTLNIKVGDIVIWTNNQDIPHTITSDSGNELASSSIPSGQTFSHTFNTAGTFAYHCSIHPSMKGTIIVS